MSLLCIDIGNTNAKAVRFSSDGSPEMLGSLPTEAIQNDPTSFDVWLTSEETSGVSFCSVVPAVSAVLRGRAAELRPDLSIYQLRHDTISMPIAYPKPSEVGGDRLAASLGAWMDPGPPCVVIDMGTATTFDILTPKGYEGGLIAPGLGLMTRYLHEQTALLPELRPESLAVSRGIGRSTQEAMRIGCVVGFTGMIDALLQTVLEELETLGVNQSIPVLATGGASGNLLGSWAERIDYRELLTFEGLRVGFEQRADHGVCEAYTRDGNTPTGSSE